MELTEDGELMVKAAQEFCETQVAERVETDLEKGIFPDDLFQEMKGLGFHLIALPTDCGGVGAGLTTALAVEKEIAKTSMTLAIIGTNCAVASLLVRMGTDEQKKKYLPEVLESPCGFAFTEPTAGSDASAIKTTAVKDGDEWVINGQKTFISFVNQAPYYLVSAVTNESGKGGISAFLVPRTAKGFEVGSIFHKLGLRGSDTGELFFNNLRVPADALIGKENKGLHASLSLLDEARMGVAACALGLSEAAIEKATEFVKERETFGRPVITNQGIQWYLAEMATKVSAANALLFEVARQYDEGENITVGSAKAKLFATQTAIEVTNQAVQMCGGYGLIEEFGVERLLRDAKTCGILEGTNEVLKIVISRSFK